MHERTPVLVLVLCRMGEGRGASGLGMIAAQA